MPDINPIHLQKALKGVDYPASKGDLLATAQKNEADDDVIGFLDGLPDREYDGPNGVSKEIHS